jgi:sugar-specific transcriptional regulator TrmB
VADSLNNLLLGLHFEQSEADTYSFLLHHGAFSVGTLAKRLGMPRTTLYTLLSRLSQRGLVRESLKAGLKIYSAETPDRIMQLFSAELSALEGHRRAFAELLPGLRTKYKSAVATPRLSVYEGQLGLQSVLKDMLLYADLETCAVWPIRKMIAALSPEFFRFHNAERIKRGLYTRAIWPHDETVAIAKFPFLGWGKEFKREIRIAPKNVSYPLGYWIYANKVAFLSSTEEGYGFIIQSSELVATLKVQFELLWSVSKQLKFNKRDVQGFLREIGKE